MLTLLEVIFREVNTLALGCKSLGAIKGSSDSRKGGIAPPLEINEGRDETFAEIRFLGLFNLQLFQLNYWGRLLPLMVSHKSPPHDPVFFYVERLWSVDMNAKYLGENRKLLS